MTQTQTPSTVVRRHMFTQTGDTLVLPTDMIQLCERVQRFTRDTGLTPAEVVFSPLVNTVIPRYETAASGPRRFSRVPAELLWHPVFWLPESIHSFSLGGDIEPSDKYAVRVAVWLSRTGLYDEDGGWADVLALHGLDIRSGRDMERVRAWQAGAPDPVLDAVRLDTLTGGEEAVRLAAEEADYTFPLVSRASVAGYGASLVMFLSELEDQEALGDDARETTARALSTVITGALIGIAHVDVPLPGGGTAAGGAYWSQLRQNVDESAGELTVEEMLAGPVSEVRETLLRLVEEYVDDFETIMAAARDEEPAP